MRISCFSSIKMKPEKHNALTFDVTANNKH